MEESSNHLLSSQLFLLTVNNASNSFMGMPFHSSYLLGSETISVLLVVLSNHSVKRNGKKIEIPLSFFDSY
jgi:hypothetical protein